MSATEQTDRQLGAAQPSWSAVSGLTHFEATGIQVTLAGKPVLILAAYLWPSRSPIGTDLTACFGVGVPVLMAGDVNAKHVDWNSRLSTRRVTPTSLCRRELLSDLWTGLPNHQPIQPLDYSIYVPEIVITKNFSFPVYLTSCSAWSSDHLPVLIDTACRQSFHHQPDRPDFRRSDWANFQTQLE